jgi:small-conductance mechanosensitive channel
MDIDFSRAIDRLQEMIDGFIASIPNLIVAFLIVLLVLLAGWVARAVVVRISRRYGRSRNLGIVMGRIAQWSIAGLGLLIGMVIVFPNFTPAQLIQFLGVGSIAISFAFRDVLENFLAGILLLLTEPFRIGDQIIINEFEGTVEEIQSRATTLRTYDGRRVVAPNGDLFTNFVIVNTAFEVRRQEYEVGIGYEEDIDKVKRLILEELQRLEEVLDKPEPDVLLYDLGEYSAVLRIRWWITPPRRSDVQQSRDRVLMAVKNSLQRNGVRMPLPTRHVLYEKMSPAPSEGPR